MPFTVERLRAVREAVRRVLSRRRSAMPADHASTPRRRSKGDYEDKALRATETK